jgi:hypothetical protein
MDKFPPLDDIKAWDHLRGELLQVEKLLHLDNVVYFPVDLGDVPPGYAEVDVLIDDRTQEFKLVMVAGLVGSNISSNGLKRNTQSGKRDTLQPIPGWWIATKVSEEVLGSMKKPSEQHPFRRLVPVQDAGH